MRPSISAAGHDPALTICGSLASCGARAPCKHSSPPAILFPCASAARGIQVTGTYRQGDGVPRPSPGIRLHRAWYPPTPISFARPTPERTAWDAKTGPITQVFEWKVRTLCVGVSVELNLHPFRNKVERVPHRLSEFPMAALLLSVAGAASSGGSPAQIGRLAWRQIDGLATNRADAATSGRASSAGVAQFEGRFRGADAKSSATFLNCEPFPRG
jgi:hypothetical protein